MASIEECAAESAPQLLAEVLDPGRSKTAHEWVAAREIERLRAENRTLRNVGISQMEQINRLLAQQVKS